MGVMQNRTVSTAIVVHGGAGAGKELDDGCVRAAGAASRALAQGADAFEAAIAAVVELEDDGRFNAGTGAALGLDGVTIEMDAAVMDTKGRLGAVACLRAVRHPVLVARDIAGTAHCMLSGEGAERFARTMGHPYYREVTAKAFREHRDMLEKLETEKPAMPGVDNTQFASALNDVASPQRRAKGACDTVGAVVRDSHGHFAVAGSTGGSALKLMGRVGDTPIIGCGFYAGPYGAVAATGDGEHIIRSMLAITVYSWIAAGMPLQQALERGIGLFSNERDVGLIAVGRTEAGASSNGEMPQAVVHHG
jgi:L-asparaginase / beta-aspartyl-peptidase